MSDSPERRISCRLFKPALCPNAATATASVGPSAAPSAKAAASGMDGWMALRRNPTTRMVTITSPMASDSTMMRLDHNATLSTERASW